MELVTKTDPMQLHMVLLGKSNCQSGQDPFFNDLSAYLAAGARMGLDNQKLCVAPTSASGSKKSLECGFNPQDGGFRESG